MTNTLNDHILSPCDHRAFLERAARTDEPHPLAGYLTLDLLDRLRVQQPLDRIATHTDELRTFLDAIETESGELDHLRNITAVVARCVTEDREVVVEYLWPSITEYAAWLESQLRLDDALDVVETAVRLIGGRHPATDAHMYLHRGRIRRYLRRFDEAEADYGRGIQAAVAADDHRLTFIGMLGLGCVARNRGNLPASEAVFRRLLDSALDGRDRWRQAMARHELGAALLEKNEVDEALVHLFLAYRLHQQETLRYRSLADVGQALRRLGHAGAAREAFELVVANQQDEGSRVSAMLELMAVSACCGDRLAFERWRGTVADYLLQLPPEEHVDYYLKVGRGSLRFGRNARAVESYEEALRLAEDYGLSQQVFQAEQGLEIARVGAAPTPVEPAPLSPASERVTHELHSIYASAV